MGNLDLLVIGDCNPDLVLGVNAGPEFGQVETLVDEAKLTLGGSASIVACGAARLGLQTALASLVGDDAFGRAQLEGLADRCVDTTRVVVDPKVRTGLSVILQKDDGDRAILTMLGSIGELRAKHVETAIAAGARHVHITPYFLLTSLRRDVGRLFALARGAGATTSLDTNWDPEARWSDGLDDALGEVDCFMPNAEEARRLTGRRSVRDAASALAERVETVVVKLGAEGAYARSGEEEMSVPAPAVKVVDTVGGGDSFNAGFLAARLSGWPLDRSLRLACSCGALSVTATGGTAGQPTMDEALRAAGLDP